VVRSFTTLYNPLTAGLDKLITKEEAYIQAVKERQNALIAAENARKLSEARSSVNPATSASDSLLGRLKPGKTFVTPIDKTNEALALTQERLANVQSAFTLVGGAVDQAFNALANGQDPLEALKQSLKQLLIQLAKAAVFALILSAVSGGAGAAGGLSFLTAFKGLLGFKASGGGVRGGGAFMVGENGPELFVPGANGAMVNNNALRGAGAGSLTATVSGNDLLFIMSKAANNRSSNFG
jgi:hypothetical protein